MSRINYNTLPECEITVSKSRDHNPGVARSCYVRGDFFFFFVKEFALSFYELLFLLSLLNYVVKSRVLTQSRCDLNRGSIYSAQGCSTRGIVGSDVSITVEAGVYSGPCYGKYGRDINNIRRNCGT